MKFNNENLRDFLTLIKKIYITEKTLNNKKENKYTFISNRTINKNLIKIIFEKILKLKLKKINIINLPKNSKKIGIQKIQKPQYKKFIVTLADNIKFPYNY